METAVIVEDDSGIRTITLNRPERMNALDGPTLTALVDALKEAAESEDGPKVIVIRGTGRAFCAGNDLKWLASGVLADRAAHMRHQDRMEQAFELISTMGPVVIASVNGFALAGGMELALSCDIIVADEDAQMGDEHIRRNLLPSGGGSQRLPRKIGQARGLYYLLTGRRMTGREAATMGLASLAVPASELEAETMALAREIARADRHALAGMKTMVRRGLELPLKEGLWLERWMQHRYRNESGALDAGVARFAAGHKSET
ncbi:MAG: enoyl-CoA hydratase/isomerase family protein [Sphingobium sp.]